MERVYNKLALPVIDKEGRLIQERVVYNTPLQTIWPELARGVVVIDWRHGGAPVPSIHELVEPVTVNGAQYRALYWGSAIKRGQMIGIRDDLGDPMKSVLRKVEDYARVGAMLLSSGFYGAGRGTPSVRSVPNGEVIGHHMIYDGHGLIKESVARRLLNNHKPIRLGRQEPSYQVSQWLDFEQPGVWEETKVALKAKALSLKRQADSGIFDDEMVRDPELEELRELSEDLLRHPYAAQRAGRQLAERLRRAATAPDWGQVTRLVVPTPWVVAPDHHGKALVWRFPVDGPTVQAVEVEPHPGWEEAVQAAEVVQYRLVGVKDGQPSCFAKGTLTIVPDDLIDTDLVIGEEDVKLGSLEFDEAVIVFTSRYAPGSAIGVEPRWFKARCGGDFDGDMVGIANANQLPATWEQIRGLPVVYTKKIPKTSTEYSELLHAEFARHSMQDVVGLASNVLSMYCALSASDRPWEALGFSSELSALKALNYNVKVGTDMYKSVLDIEGARGQLRKWRERFVEQYGVPPWLLWKRGDAFREFIPKVVPETSEKESPHLSDKLTGPVAQIAREMLPVLEHLVGKLVPARRPIQEFRDWAAEYPELREEAMALHLWFTSAVAAVDWMDVDSVQAFKAKCEFEADDATDRVGDRWALAQMVWRVAHNSRSPEASGASVFYLFPEEARRIIVERPGMASASPAEIECRLLGLDNTLQEADDLHLDVEIRIERVPTKNGKMVDRRSVLANGRAIGYVAYDSPQFPEEGRYQAHIVRVAPGRKAWNATLVPAE